MARSKTRNREDGARRGRITSERLKKVLKKAFTGWWDDNVPRMGAALAYYTLFALAPVLIVAIAVGGMAFGAEAVRGQIVGQIEGLVGREGAQTVQSMLVFAGQSSSSIAVTILGALTFFLGATGAFLELQSDLDAIWRVKTKARGGFFQDLLMQRVVSFGQILGFVFLLLTALVVSAALTAVYGYVGSGFPGAAVLWEIVRQLVSLLVVTILFALIYKILPGAKLLWGDVWVGSLVTAVLFTIGKLLIGLYLGASTFSTAYGTAGSVIVVLVWVYYSSQIILLGAEFTKAYVEEFGSRPPASEFGAEDPAKE